MADNKDSMRLRDDWAPDQSAFQADDGKYDGKSLAHTAATETKKAGQVSPFPSMPASPGNS